MEKIVLRDYQQQAVEKAVNALRLPDNDLLVLATGAGKSIVIAEIVRRADVTTLIIQPSRDILEQNYEKLLHYVDDFQIGIYSASMGEKTIRKFTFATIGSIYKKPELFSEVGLMIIDECFVAGTSVSGIDIDSIKVGDTVDSYNHQTGRTEPRKVANVMKKPAPNRLCAVTINGVRTVCTPNHPYFVAGRGYVPALFIREGDEVVYAKWSLPTGKENLPADTLFAMCHADHDNHRATMHFQEDGTHILHCGLRPEGDSSQSVGTDDGEQSDGEARSGREDEGDTSADRAQATRSGRQRHRVVAAANRVVELVARRMGRGIRGEDWKEADRGISVPLQDRLGSTGSEDRSGSGRGISRTSFTTRAGSEEGKPLKVARVDSVEVLERRSDGEYSDGSRYDFVYNLEVEDNHNYFANGTLVHNCHLVNVKNFASMFGKFIKGVNLLRKMKGLPVMKVIGCTATPYRNMVGYHTNQFGELYSSTTLKLINRVKPEFWRRILVNVGIGDLVRDGYLCPLRYEHKEFLSHEEIPLNKTTSGFDLEAYGKKLGHKEVQIIESILDAQKRFKSVLVFCPSVSVANKYATLVPMSAAVSANTPDKERQAITRAFKNGQIQTIFNVGVYTTGFDHPELECIIQLRPTRSLALHVQMLGRAVRKAPGKEFATIIDWTGTVKQLGEVESISLRKEQFPEFQSPMWEIFSKTEGGEERWHNRALYSFRVKENGKSGHAFRNFSYGKRG